MEIIPPNLTPYQSEIIFHPARFTVTEASTKVGKTYSHLIWLYGKAHEFEDAEEKHYWWVAPIYKQASIAFYRLKKYLRGIAGYSFNETKLSIGCPNRAILEFKTAENPDNLYGEDVYAAVFDEAPRAKPTAWHALYSTLTATGGPCKLIGNFGGVSNWVHQLKLKDGVDPEYKYFRITCWDAVRAGVLKESVVRQAQKDLPDPIFKALYLAEAIEGEGQLIRNECIENIFINRVSDGTKYLTGDIARLGKDKTVLMVWSGKKVIKIVTIPKSGIDVVVEKIKQLQEAYGISNANTILDEDGVGGGAVDFVKCKGFVNNSRPIEQKGKDENFSNLKAQCYYKFAESVNQNEYWVLCDDSEKLLISEELEQIRLTKEIDAKKITIKSKDEIKKEIGRSPDYSDCLMMREWFDLKPRIMALAA